MSRAVYVDFDDVLCETARSLSSLIEREFGKATAFEDIHSFDLSLSFNLDATETERLFELFHDADILSEIAPVDGAPEGIRAWRQAGADIHIVTGRPPSTRAASEAWLDAYDVPYQRLSFVDKYGRNHAPVEGTDIMTLDALRTQPFCMAIDDSPTAIRFMAERTAVPIIIFDRPWNAELEFPDAATRITRCQTWLDVLEQAPNPITWNKDSL